MRVRNDLRGGKKLSYVPVYDIANTVANPILGIVLTLSYRKGLNLNWIRSSGESPVKAAVNSLPYYLIQ